MSKLFKLKNKSDNNSYQSTVLGAEIENNDMINHYLGLAPAQQSPAAFYRNGYTVFGTMANIENNYETTMYLYNHSINKVSTGVSWGAYVSGDYHSQPIPLILPDGRILVAVSSDHNTECLIKRSINPYDVTTYETIATITDGDPAYNCMVMLGDRIYMIFRNNLIDNAIRYSDDLGATWSTLDTILNLGAYADNWAYPKVIYSSEKLMLICDDRDQSGANIFDKKYYLESVDGVNWSNIDGSRITDISSAAITASDLQSYYLTQDSAPNNAFIVAFCQWDGNPFYITQTPTDEDTLDFWYYSGSWQSKTISVTSTPLKDVNRLELLATGENSFILYAVNYDTFADSPNLQSRIIKITTSDAFDTNSSEFLTEVGNDYSLIAAHNFTDSQKTAVICLALKTRGGGTDLEPTGAFSNIKIVDVI